MKPRKVFQCPKCKYTSGNDWKQCGGACPVQGSPNYSENTFLAYDELVERDAAIKA